MPAYAILWLLGLTVLATGAVVAAARSRPPSEAPPKKRSAVKPWMQVVLLAWVVVVVAAAGFSHFDDDLALCSQVDATTSPVVSSETAVSDIVEDSAVAVGAKTPDSELTTTSTTGSSVVTTKSCAGLSVAQVAVLLVPGLLVFVPALSSLDVGGLFKLAFREVEEKVEEQAKKVEEQTDAVRDAVTRIEILQNTVSQSLQLAMTQRVEASPVIVLGDQIQEGEAQRKARQVTPLDQLVAEVEAARRGDPDASGAGGGVV